MGVLVEFCWAALPRRSDSVRCSVSGLGKFAHRDKISVAFSCTIRRADWVAFADTTVSSEAGVDKSGAGLGRHCIRAFRESRSHKHDCQPSSVCHSL